MDKYMSMHAYGGLQPMDFKALWLLNELRRDVTEI